MERSQHKPEHFYLAQIAAEIRRVLCQKPASIKLQHFLLTFDNKKPKAPTEADHAATMANSKSAWFALTGVKHD
jgi:hypothetical protein